MSQALTTVEHEINALAPQFAALLPADVSPEKFREVALAAIRRMPALLNCDRQSLFNAVLAAAQDGLMPDGREGAIVPRKGKAVWQPMIQGIYKRVKTSGSVASISANVVYADEVFDVLLGDEDRIVHRRDMSKVANGNEVAVYAIAVLKDGTKEREVMTWEQIMAVRQSSATPNDGPWVSWPDEMARKTVVRRLAKRLPVLDQADEALHRTIGRVDSLYAFGTPAPEAPQPPPDRRLSQMALAEVDAARRKALNDTIPLRSAAAATPRAERKVDQEVYEADPAQNRFYRQKPADEPTAQPQRTDEQWEVWVSKLRAACAVLKHRQEVVEIGGKDSVRDAIRDAPDRFKRDISAILAEAFERFPAEPGDDLDEVVIKGEEHIAAG